MRKLVPLAVTLLIACQATTMVEDTTDGGDSDAGSLPPRRDAATDNDADTDAGLRPAGVPLSTGDAALFDTETQVAVSPDGATVAVVWTSFGASAGAGAFHYAFSTDGGKTFGSVATVTLPPGLVAGDPAVTADANGNFYASMLGLHYAAGAQDPDASHVLVAKAPKGSTVFGAPVEASSAVQGLLRDHPKILVTQSGAVAVVYAELPSLTATTGIGVAATSADGSTFTQSTIVGSTADAGPTDAVFSNLFWLCEGQGTLYVTYYEASQTAANIVVRTSADNGKTWSATSLPVSLPSDSIAGLDPSCVASGSDVWVEYATTPTPTTDALTLDSADTILVAHSGNRGATFDAARLQALDTTASKAATLPVLTREAGGALDVTYVAGAAQGDADGTIRVVRAPTGAAAFGPSATVDGPLLYTLRRDSEQWLGDYIGATVQGGKLFAAYPINGSGASRINFRALPLQ